MTKKKAFTILELMTTLIVASVIAAWGIPQYGRMLARTRASQAIKNLRLIHAANTIYKAEHDGDNCTKDGMCGDLNAINNMNGPDSLNIAAAGATYKCISSPGRCIAEDSGSFKVTVQLSDPLDVNNPSCQDLSPHVCP